MKTKDLNEQGYTREEVLQIEKFIEAMENRPELLPQEFNDFVPHPHLIDRMSEEVRVTEDIKRGIVESYLSETHTIDLGVAVTWPDTKWEDWAAYCRTCYGHCYVDLVHPRIGEVIEDARACAFAAAAAATLAAIYASPAAALPVFKEVFYPCLIQRGYEWARSVRIALYTRNSCSRWRYCL